LDITIEVLRSSKTHFHQEHIHESLHLLHKQAEIYVSLTPYNTQEPQSENRNWQRM